MRTRRITVGNVLIAWFVFSLGTALALPPLDSRAPLHPAVKFTLIVGGALLLIATPVAAVTYFTEVWRKIGTVPNRASYIVWLGLETSAAVGVLAWVVYALVYRR